MRELWLQLEGRPGLLAGGAFVLGVIAATAVFLLTGGDGGEPPVTAPAVARAGTTTTTLGAPSTTVAAEPTLAPTTTTTLPAEPVSMNPLTGEPLAASSTQGVLAIKVDNAQAARPQVGLGTAGMIIEVPVEAGLTRFIALYFGELPPLVGPVRSVRPVDADLLAPFRPLFVHTGGRDFVLRLVDAAGIRSFDIREAAAQRLPRPSPHDLGIAPADVALLLGGPPAVEVLSFGTAGSSDVQATEVTVPFSAVTEVTWSYTGSSYRRSQNGEPHFVLASLDAEPAVLQVDTVLVLAAAARSAGYRDINGADVPTFDVVGSGDFQLFHGGTVVEGQWRRGAQADGFELVGADGTAITVPTGRIMVEIVDRTVDVSWR